jgi:hypothetical protein
MGSEQGKGAEGLDAESVEYIAGLLTDEMLHRAGRVDWNEAHMILARAGLERIRRLWHILFGNPWFSIRAPNDEEFYQRLRFGLFAQLRDRVGYEQAWTIAQDVVPDELPTSDDLVGIDEEIYRFYVGGFQRLDAELIRLALNEGIDPDPRNAEAYFVTFDDVLNELEPEAKAVYSRQARRLGLVEEEPEIKGATSSTTDRASRLSIKLEYATAQRSWRELWDEYEDRGELRRPNQREYCEWLAPKGMHISERSLRSYIRIWKGQGLAWPPPRPEEQELT